MICAKARGMVDKTAPQFKKESLVLNIIKEELALANFSQLEVPVIEKSELFLKAIGSETDVVNKELFFISSRNEEKPNELCLRPELTAGIFRLFCENKNDLQLPFKCFSVGPCFRYERPQKGRNRQFDQVSIESIGIKSCFSSIELVVLLDKLFTNRFKLAEYVLKINYLGTFEERVEYQNSLRLFLADNHAQLCSDCNIRREKNPIRCLDCKQEICQDILKNGPALSDFLTESSLAEFDTIKEVLDLACVNYLVEPSLVRGLDYYSGLVFEFCSDLLGAQNTFCGGGQYDLASSFGLKEKVLSVGAGVGVVRLLMLLDATNKQIQLQEKPLVSIVTFDQMHYSFSMLLLNSLRNNGIRSEADFSGASLKTVLKNVSNAGSKLVIFVGDDEVNNNYLKVKNFETGEEFKVSQGDIFAFLGKHV